MLRMVEALRSGISRKTLYALHEGGIVERLSRGLYRLASAPALAHFDLVTVASKAPQGVVCLISALSFHDLTTQVPHEVHVAVRRDTIRPRIDFPPVRVYRFQGRAFSEGIEVHRLDAMPVRIYSREKTIADCFKYRHKIGLDVALEALKLYKQSGRTNVDRLMHHAQICRVANVMRPYLEAVL